jgi:hypothetical protein
MADAHPAHLDDNEPDQVVPLPVNDNLEWLADVPEPASGWCFLCASHGSGHLAKMFRAIINHPTMEDRAKVEHIASTYRQVREDAERRMRPGRLPFEPDEEAADRGSRLMLQEWNERAILRHMNRHETSGHRTRQTNFRVAKGMQELIQNTMCVRSKVNGETFVHPPNDRDVRKWLMLAKYLDSVGDKLQMANAQAGV